MNLLNNFSRHSAVSFKTLEVRYVFDFRCFVSPFLHSSLCLACKTHFPDSFFVALGSLAIEVLLKSVGREQTRFVEMDSLELWSVIHSRLAN